MQEGNPEGQAAPGGDVGELAAAAEASLGALAQAMPEKGEALAELAVQLRELVAGGGGAGPDPRPEAQGMSTPEAGGNPKARPMSMGG